jgi:hypothetical protein
MKHDNYLDNYRFTEDEVRAAVRAGGLAGLNEVEAVVLETDGSFSVVQRSEGFGESSLLGVKLPGPRGGEMSASGHSTVLP